MRDLAPQSSLPSNQIMIARMLCQQFGPLPSRCASFAQRGRAPSVHYACSFAAGRSATQRASISRAGRRCTHYGSLRTVSSSNELLRHRSRVESPRSICRYYNEYQRKERQRTHNIMRQPSGTRARNFARTVLERLESLARSGDETAIELIEQRRAAEKTPTKLVKPPAYRQRKSIG
jgi:hypothetical protein